jgi:molybdopterin synthase sulfur carrier subunit
MQLQLRYFASLRDAAGIDGEAISHDGDAIALYQHLAARHGFRMPRERVRLAINGAFVEWTQLLREGDEVVFLPPMSGG